MSKTDVLLSQDSRCSSNRSNLFSLFLEPPGCLFGLNTIASSPLDSGATFQQAPRSSLSPPPRVFRRSPSDGVGHDLQYSRRKHPESACCHGDGGADDVSDSGWSDVNDPPDIVGFIDSEDASCGCSAGEKVVDTTSGEEQVFELEMNNDIDLEQIEKD